MKPVRRFAALVVMAALIPLAQAQQDPPLDLPKLSEVIDVRIINVDVVVTDRKGIPVSGLTKDDFELYENGQLKPITNFYEVEGRRAVNQVFEAPPTPAPGAPAPASPPAIVRKDETPENLRRRIIFYVDNLSLATFNRNRVFK